MQRRRDAGGAHPEHEGLGAEREDRRPHHKRERHRPAAFVHPALEHGVGRRLEGQRVEICLQSLLQALPIFAIHGQDTALEARSPQGFLLGDPGGAWPLLLAGVIMLLGRFWWPADLIRQFVWRVAEPAGWLVNSI